MQHKNDMIINYLIKDDREDEASQAAVPEDVKIRAGKVVDILTAE